MNKSKSLEFINWLDEQIKSYEESEKQLRYVFDYTNAMTSAVMAKTYNMVKEKFIEILENDNT